MGMSVPSLHRESTDSLINLWKNESTRISYVATCSIAAVDLFPLVSLSCWLAERCYRCSLHLHFFELSESTASVVDSSLKIEFQLSAIQFCFSGSKYMTAFVSKSSNAFI